MSGTLSRTSPIHPAGLCRTCRSKLSRRFAPPSTTSAPFALPLIKFRTTEAAPRHRERKLGDVSGSFEDDLSVSESRWARNPQAMRSPVGSGFRGGFRAPNPNDDFDVNEDPEKLCQAIDSFIGRDGHGIIPEEVRWLAVTHKSFDHGKSGFNERLSYYGYSIIRHQLALRLLNAPKTKRLNGEEDEGQTDKYGRVPFQHPSLEGLDNVNLRTMDYFLSPKRIAGLAERHGLQDVVRWKPRQIRKLQASGLHAVLVDSIGAIIGAVALHNGGETANRITRERMLTPLGVP